MLRESSAVVPRSRAARLLGLTLAGVLWSSTLWALEYDYDAPDECPDRAAFLEEVRIRLRYPAEQSSVERLRVTVRRQQAFEAGFVLVEPGQPPVTRTLTAEVCEEAVQALALGAALALDARYREVRGIPEGTPEASAASLPVEAAASSEAVSPPAVETPPPSAPAASVAVIAQPPPAERPTPVAMAAPAAGLDEPPSDPRVEPSESNAPTLAARLGAFAATGYAPDPSFGPSLGVMVRNHRFALELEAFFGAENRAGNGEQSAEFWVVGGRLTPCVRWSLPGRFWMKGCGLVELSGVHAEGVESADVVTTAEDLAPYWALGVVAGVEAPLTQALSLGLDLGVQFPLSQRRFEFVNVDEPLHEFPSVAARGQLSICYAF